jgi:hypothetical protein
MYDATMRNVWLEVGDIVFDNHIKLYYLVLRRNYHEDDYYYYVIDLQDGSYTTIGYWDYILPSRWEKVA